MAYRLLKEYKSIVNNKQFFAMVFGIHQTFVRVSLAQEQQIKGDWYFKLNPQLIISLDYSFSTGILKALDVSKFAI